MARHDLSAFAALCFFAFALPLAAARLGGRSCHTSFFFPDPDNNNNHLRTLTLLRAEDSNDNGASADFKIFSIAAAKVHASAWIEHLHVPPSLVQVRLLRLHRQQTLLKPGLAGALDAPSGWRHAAEKPFAELPTHREIVRTWSVSTSNPHRPITWIDIHSHRGMMRHEFSDHMEQNLPLRRDDDNWVNDLERMALGLLFGAATGMVFAVTLTLIWSVLRRLCARSRDNEDVGFLYGYQELPSPRAAEKEDVKGSQKEFTKEKSAGMVENM